MRITVISGTNRPGNLSLQVARACQEILSEQGRPATLLDLKDLPREIAFDYLQDGLAPGFEPFQAAVDAADH